MPPIYALILAVFAPAALGLVGMALPRRAIATRVGLAVFAPIVSIFFLSWHIYSQGTDAPPVSVPWMPSIQLALSFHADRLGLFFAMLVAGIGVLITLYTRAYFGPDQNALYRIYPSLLLFMTGMLGVVLADNFVLLLLFWELTSISSFLLIGWERDDSSAVKSALQAFIVTGTGGIALLGGLVLLGIATGQWHFSSLVANVDLTDVKVTAAFLLIMLGAMTKSAQWPFHFWLPGAMAAPTPISAYLHSATMVKAGVYLIGRLSEPLAALAIWPWVLIPIGTITMVLGAYIALRKTDLKLIFAYTTVSQLGLFVCMYGLSAFQYESHPALVWDVTQILNHALYKAPLFILAGTIAHVVYSRDLRDLKGLFHRGAAERRVAILLLLAVYAMAAGPLTLGFTAKEFFLYGLTYAHKASGHPILIAVMAATVCQGALNVAICFRFGLTLLSPATEEGSRDPEAEEEHIAYEDYHAIQHGFWLLMLWVPAALLIALQYVGGIVPQLFNLFLAHIERTPTSFKSLPSLWYIFSHPSLPLMLSLLAIGIGVFIATASIWLGRAPIWQRGIRDWHDKLFPWFYGLVTQGGGRLFGLLQTGNLRLYLFVICIALVSLVAWAVLQTGVMPDLSRRSLGDPHWLDQLPVYAVGALVAIAAVLMPSTQRRAGRVMILGAAGFSVAGLFYLYNAPDVALTQVSIEIVALILFLLALGLLPRTLAATRERFVFPARLVVAIAVGIAMFWLTLSSSLEDRAPMSYVNAASKPFADLGDFFLRNAYKGEDVVGRHPGGGGNNVVNVILVDFRGFDTFGEITVLGIAALGVIAMLHRALPAARSSLVTRNTAVPLPRRRPASSNPHAWVHGLSLSSEPLRVVTKLLVPLGLLFACFIFFKGHQEPGGGFVAGLVAAIALIAHRMAHGRASLRHMVRVRPRILIGIGLLLALITGAAPMLFGMPFLTSRYGYVTLPGTNNQLEWATVLGFDLGVFFVVLGVVLAMINLLSEEGEAA